MAVHKKWLLKRWLKSTNFVRFDFVTLVLLSDFEFQNNIFLSFLQDQHSVKQVPKCDAIVFSQGQQTISQHRQQHNYHALRRRLTPSRHDNNNKSQSNINSQELYQHTIQCKKLAELSIQKATRYSHQQKFLNINNGNIQFSASSWMPQDALLPREKIKLRSAEERRRRCIIQQQPQSSLKKASGIKGGGGGGEGERGYSQIIKRVLEHYDPSRNQVRTRMPPSSQQQQHHPGGGLSAKGLVATTWSLIKRGGERRWGLEVLIISILRIFV